MILSCPECSTRFAVGDDKLRPDGRRVKCGKCGHIWFEAAPPEPERDFDQPPIAVTPLYPDEQAPYRPANLPATRAPDRGSAAGAAWTVVAVLVVAIAAIVWFGREPIARAWPGAENLYLAAGLHVFPDPGEGLTVDFTARAEDGFLALRGEVVNVSDEERMVPTLYVAVTDSAGGRLHVHGLDVAAPRLGPGERVPFTTEVRPVPKSAANVSVLFTRPAENP